MHELAMCIIETWVPVANDQFDKQAAGPGFLNLVSTLYQKTYSQDFDWENIPARADALDLVKSVVRLAMKSEKYQGYLKASLTDAFGHIEQTFVGLNWLMTEVHEQKLLLL